jgi:trk system potassium uptake protein TrkA
MYVVIVGGGLVGATLAGKLAADGADVTLVESDSAKVRQLTEELDVQVVEGNGSTARALRRAGVEKAGLLLATTDSDECNMVAGLLAIAAFKVPRVVVRLRDDDHADGFAMIDRLHAGEHVRVNPEAAAVDRIASLLEVPGAADVVSLLDGRLLVAGFRISATSDFNGLNLAHMNLLFPATPTLVVAIQRDSEWIVPHGEQEITAGDLVYFAIARQELSGVLALVGARADESRHVMIAGASRIGLALARRLERGNTKVVLVEESAAEARRAAETLGSTLVITGQVTDQTVLEEEDIDRVSTFVAVTGDHEVNLVSSLLAKKLGANRAFTLVDNPSLANLIGDVGIDAVISPRLLAIGLALQHIRRGRVRSVSALLEDKVEVIEIEAVDGSRLTSAPLADVGLPRGILVAAVNHGDELRVPGGGDRVAPGDQVVLITTTEHAGKLDEVLGKRR